MASRLSAPLTRRAILIVASTLAVLAAALPFSAEGQAPAPKSETLLLQRFSNVSTPAARFDLVQSVFDFGPGATSFQITTTETHFLAAIGGDLVADIDGTPQTIAAGKGVAAPAAATITVSNPSTAATSRLMVSSLLEVGAVSSVHQLSGPGVAAFATSRLTMSGAPSTVDIVQTGSRYDVGFKSPTHTMNQPHLITHTEGITEYGYLDGTQEAFRPPAQAQMYVGMAGSMRNAGATKSSFLVTWVSATGAPPLTSPVASPGAPAPLPPRTGTGPSSEVHPSNYGLAVAVLLVVGGGAAMGTFVVQRRRAR